MHPKCRVIFNKLEKIVRLVCFTIEISHKTLMFHLGPLASSQWNCRTYTWRCMYSLGLLMMDGKTVRNM